MAHLAGSSEISVVGKDAVERPDDRLRRALEIDDEGRRAGDHLGKDPHGRHRADNECDAEAEEQQRRYPAPPEAGQCGQGAESGRRAPAP